MPSSTTSKQHATSKKSWLQETLVQLFWVDVRSLRFFRICLGALLLMTYVNYFPYASRLLSDDGVYTRTHALFGTSDFFLSLYLANGTTVFAMLLLLISIFFAIAIIINWHTRWSVLASSILFESLNARNTEILFGLHVAMISILFWTFFLPTDDELRSQKKKRILSIAALGIVLNSAAILYGAGIAKYREYDFWMGNANALQQLTTYYTNQNALTHILQMSPSLLRLLSRLTVIIEFIAVPILFIPVWISRVRIVSLIVSGLLFLGITLCIHVGIFPMLPYVSLFVLIPSSVWDAWEKTAMRRHLLQSMRSLQTRSLRLMRSVYSAIRQKVLIVSRWIAWGFFLIFLIASLNNSISGRNPLLSNALNSSHVSQLLSFFGLNNTWDWVYGGPMHTKLLIAEFATDHGSFVEDLSSTPYQGPFYNYAMNYTNAIMRNDWLVNRYLSYYCTHPGSTVPAGATIQSIKLHIVVDAADIPGVTQNKDIYSSIVCPVGNAVALQPEAIAPQLQSGPTDLTSFPILDMQQDFKTVQFGKNVSGNMISLGGVQYPKGVGGHANGRVTFFVSGATHFSVVAGLDDEVKDSTFSSVVLRIEGDGKELYRSPMLVSANTPQAIQLDIAGVSRLSLITEDAGVGQGTTLNYDDHVSWGNPLVWK